MTALVTGASGFIGSRLAAALVEQGESVRVLHREGSRLSALAGLPVERHIGDIMDPSALERAVDGCDVVYHVAAVSAYWREAPEVIYAVNVDGTRNVVAACRKAGVSRVVHTSSVAAIGIPHRGVLGTEETPFDRVSANFPYADSKRLAEEEVQRAVAQGLVAVIVNPAVVIGAGDHHLISGSIIVQLARRPLPIVPPGGVCVADVDAVVQGHLLAARLGRPGERYILGGENLTYREIADVVAAMVSRAGPRRTIPGWMLGPAGGAVTAYNRVSRRSPVLNGQQVRLSRYNLFFDSSKAVRELGYPLLPFCGAAAKAYRWYRDNGFLV
jgi:dihydroflavonol-4-reductase